MRRGPQFLAQFRHEPECADPGVPLWRKQSCLSKPGPAKSTRPYDGSNTVWRFAHNHNTSSCYYGESFAQISNDGKWALFSSTWDGTLGADTAFGCKTRIDTFIVELSATTNATSSKKRQGQVTSY